MLPVGLGVGGRTQGARAKIGRHPDDFCPVAFRTPFHPPADRLVLGETPTRKSFVDGLCRLAGALSEISG